MKYKRYRNRPKFHEVFLSILRTEKSVHTILHANQPWSLEYFYIFYTVFIDVIDKRYGTNICSFVVMFHW